MKVFINKRYGSYSGGLVIVAANNTEEAHAVIMSEITDEDDLRMIDKKGEICYRDELCVEKIHLYYKKENWVELDRVISDYKIPTLISEDGYTE